MESRAGVGNRRQGRCLCRRCLQRTIASLATEPWPAAASLHRREWTAADLPGAALAIGDFRDDDEAAAFAAAARAAGVPVNVIDKPAYLRFFLRRHRQPLAAGGRHFDGRRRAGLCPGDPRQDRSAVAAGVSRAGLPPPRVGAAQCRRPACPLPAGASFGGCSRAAPWPMRTANPGHDDFDRFIAGAMGKAAVASNRVRSPWSVSIATIPIC